MNPDLHTHTLYSDGELSPDELVERAIGNGVTHLAITDHDTTIALEKLSPALLGADINIISGVEISCLWPENEPGAREVHIVGLFVDRQNEELETLLSRQRRSRRERAAEIDRKLQAAGATGLGAYIDALPCHSVGRNHAARFLIDKGLVSTKQQAFKKWLGNGGRIQVKAEWCSMPTALHALEAAGGIAVLAHPSRYSLANARLRRLVREFAEHGGAAIEVSYSNLSPDKVGHMAALCQQHDLYASIGSDFHNPGMTWMDVGRIRKLPDLCADRAVWQHRRWAV